MACLTRRNFVTTTTLGGLFSAIGGALETAAAAPKKASNNTLSIEKWMDAWMNARTAVSGPLHLTRFKDPIYVLLDEISWSPSADLQGKYEKVIVPKGFVTDFASIPRPFWSLLRPDGEYTYPAIIHDYLYWTQGRTRENSDNIFKLAMIDFKIPTTTSDVIYNAVRVAGRSAWNSNAALKAKGEKRILKVWPDDPTVRWDTWKRKPGVFVS